MMEMVGGTTVSASATLLPVVGSAATVATLLEERVHYSVKLCHERHIGSIEPHLVQRSPMGFD